MRTSEEYQKLVRGYAISLGLLKRCNKKAYSLFARVKNIFQKNNTFLAQMVRDLRVDFSRENDDLTIGEARIVVLNHGFLKGRESFAIAHMPAFGYALSLMHSTEGFFGEDRKCYILYPLMEEYLQEENISRVLDVSTLKDVGEDDVDVIAKKSFMAGVIDGELEVVVMKNENPERLISVKTMPVENAFCDIEQYEKIF